LTLALGFLFAVYVGLDDLVTGLPPAVAELRFVNSRWNWSGKTYSLILSIIVIIGLGMGSKAVGLVLPQRKLMICSIALIPLSLIGVLLGFIFKPSPPSAETFVFQAMMPGLAEELAYRGIAPALLLGLIRGKSLSETIPWTVICIAAVPFGVVHGLGYSGGEFSFDMVNALYICSGGIIYGWMRFASGSLLFPFLAHSCGNVAFQLTAFA
jgi:uncharacterized protein